MRIAVGGFQHETNTFAPVKATLADFIAADAWPGLVRGAEMFDAVGGINLPISGFIDAARAARDTTLPLTWCSATPSGHVTQDAYEHIAGLLLDDIRTLRPDAVYLDLHGAMAAEHIDDADGELLRRVRSLIGPKTPLVASLDFHANVSQLMVDTADALIAYRTYPHVDMAETGARTHRALRSLKEPTRGELAQLPFLIPLTSQCTLIDPLQSLMQETMRLERDPVLALHFTPGFPATDVVDCGPSIFGYGSDREVVRGAVQAIMRRVEECESDFAVRIESIESAIRKVRNAIAVRGKPIVLADTQDNPGGGGNADTTSLLKALLAAHLPNVLAGVLFDPEAAARAHAAGEGAILELNLGAGTRFAEETPLHGRFTVRALGDGNFTGTGPFYLGTRMTLGPMALLQIDELTIAVASRKQQAADRAMFHHLRVDPRDFAVVALKSSVHFRADFGPIARDILVVEAPGPNIADPSKLPFRKLRPGMRMLAS